MVLNKIRVLAMPTWLQALPPLTYCKNLALSLAEIRTLVQAKHCGVSKPPAYSARDMEQ